MGIIFSHEVAGYLYLAYWAWMRQTNASEQNEKFKNMRGSKETDEPLKNRIAVEFRS